jgi:hypothetical protein
MFAYCGNNPIARKDDGGEFWNWVVGATVGALVGAINTAVEVYQKDGWDAFSSGKTWAKIGVSAACGTINGLVAASGACYVTGGFVGGLTGAVESMAHQLIDSDGDFSQINGTEVLTDFTVGMIGSAAGGNGAIRGSKYMAYQGKSFAKHAASKGTQNAVSFYYKMTANYSKQFIRPTVTGISRGFAAGKLASYALSN